MQIQGPSYQAVSKKNLLAQKKSYRLKNGPKKGGKRLMTTARFSMENRLQKLSDKNTTDRTQLNKNRIFQSIEDTLEKLKKEENGIVINKLNYKNNPYFNKNELEIPQVSW